MLSSLCSLWPLWLTAFIHFKTGIQSSHGRGSPEGVMTSDTSNIKTEVGNYFVSNYPPFSQWKPENIPDAINALNQAPRVGQPLGLYIHIPFCRKRCKFCYFKVYTDKNASEIEVYLNALISEN